MAGKQGIRALATAPLAPFKHERVTVNEWGGATLIVRQLTAGDWIDYRAAIVRAREAIGTRLDEVSELPINVVPATALVLARTLFDEEGKRILTDADADDVAASFSEVHGRLVDKAFELSGISAGNDEVAEAGNG
ncbi:phage tail assembly chaperone [Luteimonas sp. S4-F44]|uniref:phage tail assembly chaperone n=1 Tax=Luteimonas sp. S4-F44 TaxID=2925842 RepID=UPI001F53AAAB|nr:phage tail assembly chaperone [Luteimonas sp. S4-F44]UNK43450.1 phage tail assembly chaperone [Luteimonas sp. S4-F44]